MTISLTQSNQDGSRRRGGGRGASRDGAGVVGGRVSSKIDTWEKRARSLSPGRGGARATEIAEEAERQANLAVLAQASETVGPVAYAGFSFSMVIGNCFRFWVLGLGLGLGLSLRNPILCFPCIVYFFASAVRLVIPVTTPPDVDVFLTRDAERLSDTQAVNCIRGMFQYLAQ